MLSLVNNNQPAFFALLKAGLWEKSVKLLPFEPLDFDALYQMADDQSIVGLLSAGLERVEDRKVTKPEALLFLKKVFSLEGRNASMNSFIEDLTLKMRRGGIYTILVKGQGVAQCYERPLWRSSGDIDFWLDGVNYENAKRLLSKAADSVEAEGVYSKHLGLMIDSWMVELHGTLRCGLSSRIDRALDAIQRDTLMQGRVRVWRNGETDIFLPGPDNDAILIFTHILQHFYKGGIGLRQVCDWCRLLWTYRDSIDSVLLNDRLRSMRLMSEWRAFAAFAVNDLGMPVEAMPLYDSSEKWTYKANYIREFIMRVGNFGQNRDMIYYKKNPYLIRKSISLARRVGDLCRHVRIFPLDSVRFLPKIVFNGFLSAIRGE